MPADGATANRRNDISPSSFPETPIPVGNGIANGFIPVPTNSSYRLRLNPNQEHQPENYADLESEFTPMLFSSLERYLPPNLLNASREMKHRYMREILRRYSTDGERNRVSVLHFIYSRRYLIVAYIILLGFYYCNYFKLVFVKLILVFYGYI